MSESENRKKINIYKKMLNQVPDLIFHISWETNDIYKILFLSESVNHLFEYDGSEIDENTNLFFRERILFEDLPGFRERLELSRATLTHWCHEFRVRLPIKGLRWMRLSAKPELQENGSIQFYGRISDITEQKEQEQQLQISEERYKFALKAASEGIWGLGYA